MTANSRTAEARSSRFLRPIALLALAAALIGTSGCNLFVEHPTPKLTQPHAAIPRDFLWSWHKPYNKWMDAPVRVYYNKVPLDQVFKTSPFNNLSYRFIEQPDEMPLVSADSLGISRRQLLWAVAHDNNLHMSLKTLPNGHPSEVIIRHRGEPTSYKGVVDR